MSLEILAMGARTPVGLTAESSAAAVRARISRLKEHPFMVDDAGDRVRAAFDPLLSADLLGMDRLGPLLESAIREAIGKLGTLPTPTAEVLLALPEARPGFPEGAARKVAEAVSRSLGPHYRVELTGQGHAGALRCLEVAEDRVTRRPSEICIVAGADSYFHGDTLDWLAEQGQLSASHVRGGFIPGEAAGALVLGGAISRRRLGLRTLAHIRAVKTAVEKHPQKSEHEGLGEGLTVAVQGVVESLRLPDDAVDAVFCDINGERYRSEEWGFAVLRLGQALRTFDYEAPCGSWGDVGAASGVLFSILAARSWARAYARGPRALVWCSSEGGLRGAALLEQPDRP